MGKSDDLLRMLEPAVRPGNLPAPRRAPVVPIEQRDFESILGEAQQLVAGLGREMGVAAVPDGTMGQGQTQAKPSADGSGALTPLTGIDRVENPALRRLIGGAGAGQ